MLRYTIIGDTVVDPDGEWVPWGRVEYQITELKAENAELKAERDDLVEAIEKALVEWPYPDAFTRILGAVISRGEALAGEGADVSTPKNVDGGNGGKETGTPETRRTMP